MRISDWSSDVCSSDLDRRYGRPHVGCAGAAHDLDGPGAAVPAPGTRLRHRLRAEHREMAATRRAADGLSPPSAGGLADRDRRAVRLPLTLLHGAAQRSGGRGQPDPLPLAAVNCLLRTLPARGDRKTVV